jgi:hypothetical protein
MIVYEMSIATLGKAKGAAGVKLCGFYPKLRILRYVNWTASD